MRDELYSLLRSFSKCPTGGRAACCGLLLGAAGGPRGPQDALPPHAPAPHEVLVVAKTSDDAFALFTGVFGRLAAFQMSLYPQSTDTFTSVKIGPLTT
jgi:hypothetical protein